MPVLYRIMDIIFALSTPLKNWAYSKAPLKVSGIMDSAYAAAQKNNAVKGVIKSADLLTDKCTMALDSWMETQGVKYPIIAQTRQRMIHLLHFCEAMVEPLCPRPPPRGFGENAPNRQLAIHDSFDFDWSTESNEFDLRSSPETTLTSTDSPSSTDQLNSGRKDDDSDALTPRMRLNADALSNELSDDDSPLPEALEGNNRRRFDVRSAMAPVAIEELAMMTLHRRNFTNGQQIHVCPFGR